MSAAVATTGKLVAIASSLGGARVLKTIFSQLPANFPLPIVIAQHISEGFAETLAEWLGTQTALQVRVAADRELLLPGQALIAPPEYNLQIVAGGKLRLLSTRENEIYHPSCDLLLSSAASVYGENTIGIILTGMGRDGVKGMQAIKTAGGTTIAQDEYSSLIYNMPRLVIEQGMADFVLAAEDIAAALLQVAST